MDTVNTKKAERRTLSYESLAEVSADLDAIQAAHDARTLRHSGNWTPGEVLKHTAIFMTCAIDGFPSKAPAPIRWIAQALWKKKALEGGATPAGFKIPNAAGFLRPEPGIGFDDGMAALREQIARIENGEKFTKPSGLFGELTHEQWMVMQLGHFKLHMSFLHPA